MRNWRGSTNRRRRLTSSFGSPGAGSIHAGRSSTAVTQTRRPSSTSASKSGRISSSSSIETLSRRTSSVRVFSALLLLFGMLITHLPDNGGGQTGHRIEPSCQTTHAMNTGLVTLGIPLGPYGRSLRQDGFGRGPIQMCPENVRELRSIAGCGRLGVDTASRDRFDRGRTPVGMPAWDDALEVAEVGRQVQGEAVADHRAVELDPDRGQLLAVAPDAREAGLARLRFDAKRPQVVDQRLLEELQVARDAQAELGAVEHRVTHQLASAVVRCLSSPV